MSTNGVDLYGAALAPTAFGLSNGMPAFAQSSALPAGTNMNDTLSRGTSHASIVDQLSSAQVWTVGDLQALIFAIPVL